MSLSIHCRLLQYYIELGAIVTKVHRAVRFEQEALFANYIDRNSRKRAEATSKFAKDLYKLKNNSLFGKLMENLRKRSSVRLCNTPKKLVTYCSKVSFKRSIEIAQDLIGVLLSPEHICLDRPVFMGQAILDLSKLRMYKLQYSELAEYRKRFNCKINILAGDTDSFFLQCKNVSLRSQLLPAMIEDGLLDTSNYPPNHELYSNKFACQIGKFKDEGAGVAAYKEWVFLRPKCYSLLSNDEGYGTKKAKGVSKLAVQKKLTHADYKRVYEDAGECVYVKQARIGSVNHQLYTMSSSKRALTCIDDKRAWTDGNTSYAYGHYRFK